LFSLTALSAAAQNVTLIPEEFLHPYYATAASLLTIPVQGGISVNRYDTMTALMRLLTYGAVFWLAFAYSRNRDRADKIIITIASATTTYALYGLVIHLANINMVAWYPKYAYMDDLTATFVNRNSFATYVGIGVLAALMLFLRSAYRDFSRLSAGRSSIIEVLSVFSTYGWLAIISLFTLFTALYLTHSRAGMVATFFGAAIFFIATTRQKVQRFRYALVFGSLFAFLAMAVMVISGEKTLERLGDAENSIAGRQSIYLSTVELLTERPLLGVGYGTYQYVIPPHRPALAHLTLYRAHNTYLENVVELGLVAGGSLILALALLGYSCMVTLSHSSSGESWRAALGIAVTAMIATHSLVDFSLQIPGVAIPYAALMGATCAGSSQASRKPERSTPSVLSS
jgi:O-antigen ligase